MHRKSVEKTAMPRATKPLERVYTDVCEPMRTVSMSGAKYLLIFVDDCTRYTWVCFIRQKSDVAKVTANWERMVTNRFGCSIKAIHSNNGGEYIGKEFQDWIASREILHEPTAPYTPEHNGVAE
jgi:transposase InsO family protein